MNSFPFTPKHTVVFFPSKMNVKMSPYWNSDQLYFFVSEDAANKYLLPTAEKELIRVNAIGDSTADEWHPVED